MAVEPASVENSHAVLVFDRLFPETAYSIAFKQCVTMWQTLRARRGLGISEEQTGELVDHLVALHGAVDCVIEQRSCLLDDIEYLSDVVSTIADEHTGSIPNEQDRTVICSRVLLERLQKKLEDVVAACERT